MSLTVTALYASLLALIFLYLSFRVIGLRRSLKVGLGDGGEDLLVKATRIHANFSEYIPLALILLACYEVSSAGSLWVHVFGATLVVGRILHAIGLTKSVGISSPRIVGMSLTFLVLFILAILNIGAFVTL